MMKDSVIAIALSSALALSPASYALAKTPANDDQPMKTAARDFTKLSEDGFGAFRNIHLARLALFDGKVHKAKRFVSKAQSSLATADSDDAAFVSAMADLQPPKAAKKPHHGPANIDVNEKVKWLPIDAEMALTEEYVVSPKNEAAVAKANTQLKQGDRKGAMETLKVAGVDLEYSTVLLPIEQTKTALQSTIKELDSDKYYQANLTLKGIEDSMVVDVSDVLAEPESTKTGASAKDTSVEDTSAKAASAQATGAKDTSPHDTSKLSSGTPEPDNAASGSTKTN